MTFYEFDARQVHIHEEGPADGPVAVFIHGWSSSSYTWQTVLPTLARRYHCLAVDLPGFGESPAVAHPSIAGYADLIARIIERFSPDKSVLVLGHSMGGQIAATLALRHPPLVERLVLLNPAISGRLSTRVELLLKPHVMAERFRPIEWLLYLAAKTPIDYTDRLLKPTNFAERASLDSEVYQRIRADARRRGQGRTRAICYNAMRVGDLRGDLGHIEAPALVLWGAEDNVVPLRDAGVVAAEWPRADLRLIPNAGHWPQFEQEEMTLRYIAQFLGLPPLQGGKPWETDELADIKATAAMLVNSEVGGKLTEAQRLRLASLLHVHRYSPGENVARAGTVGDEMYVVREGTLEVWLSTRAAGGTPIEPVRLATITAGQVSGELALLDDATRSADLRAGPEGVTLLALTREAFDSLNEDDPAMGARMMQSLAISLGRRLRHQNYRAARATAPEPAEAPA